ncbi:hypothetical protein HID58_042275 [Brassica napus]|uniref:Uncharacterized protein n=1 Tax=Brassica napus TaxID=3708 RepID=A0ABQ8BD98_BRANA|nr:hypothetical protein HID58_042275 [Brassica napus]
MAGDVGETNDRFFKFGEEKESKERKEKALKEIEMGNAAYNATVLSDLLGKLLSLNVIMFDCCEESLVFSL